MERQPRGGNTAWGGFARARDLAGEAVRTTKNQLAEAAQGGDLVDVTMLGSTGTGKTTLLVSMYHQFDRVIGDTDLAVTPDRATSLNLHEYLAQLSSLPGEIQVTSGVEGTGQVREYRLGVGRRGKPSLFTLRFTDYPGKYLLTPSTTDADKLQRALGQADVVLVAIDTPALLERGGKYHNVVNTPGRVIDQLKEILRVDTPRLIILVPLKCESALSTPHGPRLLTEAVREKYQPLLNFIGAGDLRERVGCVLAPARTLGSVLYSRVTEAEGNPVFHFRSTRPDAAFEPVDTDQPLRYALRFVVNKYRMEERGVLAGWLQKLVKTDAALLNAVEQFADGCRRDVSFQVLQDHTYLHRGR